MAQVVASKDPDFLIATVQNLLVLVTKALGQIVKSKGIQRTDKGSSEA